MQADSKNLVKTQLLDRYLATLLAPDDKQADLFALYAFDSEIRRIAPQVSEAHLGEIRIQWWYDNINLIYQEKPVDNPVAADLARVIHEYDLPRHKFINLLEARRFDLYSDPVQSMQELLKYVDATSVPIVQMAAQILIRFDALAIDDLALHAGRAEGLSEVIGSLARHTARGQCYLPQELMRQHGLETVESGRPLDLVLAGIRHEATKNLVALNRQSGRIDKKALSAFWPSSLAGQYLKLIAKPSFDALKLHTGASQLSKQWLLMKKSFLERV